MTEKKYENIIWDWNGTLLNDIDICIQSMNHLLAARNLPLLEENRYRTVFTFPVQRYYESIGFNFSLESFDIPALEFINHYKKYLPSATLFPEVEHILQYFKKQNIKQYVLSAMEQLSLEDSIESLNIGNYFNKIVGICDHFARSKVERGLQLIETEKMQLDKTLLVGDTLHDFEVANALGIKCILVAQGHFMENRLRINENIVIQNLNELKERL